MIVPLLDSFQEEALDFFDAANGRVVYADPMGARKTGTTLSWLARRTDLGKTLVVAPGSVHGHWLREAERFFPAAGRIHLSGTPKDREIDREGIKVLDGPLVAVTSYALLTKDVEQLIKIPWDTIVFDEAHRLKGRRTQVALAANKVSKRVPHVILATGTPVMNHPAEVWQYLHVLEPQAYSAFWDWAERFFFIEQKPMKRGQQPTRLIHGFRPGMEEVLRASLRGRLLQREIHDLFGEQPWTLEPEHIPVEVELSPKERKEYQRLVDHGWGKVGDALILTPSSLVVHGRLQQLSSDWGVMNDMAETGSKVKAAIELISDLRERGPVVVFATYKETVRRLVEGLGDGAIGWTGDVKQENKEVYLRAFGHGCDVIVGTLASLGEGVDGLQLHSHQIVMLDRHWVPALNDQAIGRLRRSGQREQVTVWHLYAKDTLDASVVDACLRKVAFADSLAGRPAREILYGRGTELV